MNKSDKVILGLSVLAFAGCGIHTLYEKSKCVVSGNINEVKRSYIGTIESIIETHTAMCELLDQGLVIPEIMHDDLLCKQNLLSELSAVISYMDDLLIKYPILAKLANQVWDKEIAEKTRELALSASNLRQHQHESIKLKKSKKKEVNMEYMQSMNKSKTIVSGDILDHSTCQLYQTNKNENDAITKDHKLEERVEEE